MDVAGIKESLLDGAIDKDTRLATDLAGPPVKVDKEEMEKRGLDSRMTETLWLSRSRTRYLPCAHSTCGTLLCPCCDLFHCDDCERKAA